METKKSLRESMKRRLEAQPPPERDAKSRIIQTKLFELDAFQKAKSVCFYTALPSEVDTQSMIEEAERCGKRVLALPTHGNQEPPVHERFDCIVVPGLVFDRAGNRLGRGKGFYDRFLSGLAPGVFKIGLAFAFQIVPAVPVEAHDVRLDRILTD